MSSFLPNSHACRRRRRRWLALVLSSGLVLAGGCKIPCLRAPLAGPKLPADYALNNGEDFPGRLTTPERVPAQPASYVVPVAEEAAPAAPEVVPGAPSEVPAASEEETPSAASSKRGPLQSLVKMASFLKLAPNSQEADEPQLNDAEEPAATFSVTDESGLIPIGGAANSPAWEDSAASTANTPRNVFYSDPCLQQLITETLSGNQELRILAEEIRIASNEAYARSGEYRPFVTLGAGAGLEKTGEFTRDGAVESQLEVAPDKGFPDPLGNFLVAADISWELDIWNRLRNSQRAAAMRYLATAEGRNYVVTRMVAEVAENYYQLLALDNIYATLERTIEIQQSSLQVASANKAAGRGTELAVQRFAAEVEKNRSQLAIIRQQIVEAENRINFLAGRYPQPVERLPANFIDMNLGTLAAGVPSELLQQRADIRQAEREVAAAGLDVRVARARFYPSLSLTAGLGWNAFSTGYLFRTPESLIYGLTGELVGPLINKRAIQAAYSSANAAQLQSIYNYQQTVLEAHIEVVNLLTKVENLRTSIDVKRDQLTALEASVNAANQLFQNARAEYVEVLLAQRELQEARMELIDTKQEQLSAIVNAYQALGGGL